MLERPRLSLLSVFFITGVASLLASFLLKWRLEPRGRFPTSVHQAFAQPTLEIATDQVQYEDLNTQLPDRPKRHSLLILALCIAARAEMFHRVNRNQQCSSPGIEVSLLSLLPDCGGRLALGMTNLSSHSCVFCYLGMMCI